jgi:hypothetical protein
MTTEYEDGGPLLFENSALLPTGETCSIVITVECGLCDGSASIVSGQAYPLKIQDYYGGVFSYSLMQPVKPQGEAVWRRAQEN